MSSLKQWRFAGIITIISLGFLLHYIYSWTGNSKIVGVFVPVNESVWEHLKLGYWSVVLFSIAEHLQLRKSVNNFYVAKLIGVLTLETTVLLIFYGYTSIVGKNIFWWWYQNELFINLGQKDGSKCSKLPAMRGG